MTHIAGGWLVICLCLYAMPCFVLAWKVNGHYKITQNKIEVSQGHYIKMYFKPGVRLFFHRITIFYIQTFPLMIKSITGK